MEISAWDIAAVVAKALTYAATLCAAGGIFFLSYCGQVLTAAQQGRVRRSTAVLLGAALACSIARIPLLSASMSGELAGLWDLSSARMLLSAGEGRATTARLLGIALAAVALAAGRPTSAAALLGAALAAVSFSFIGHVHALPSLAPSLFLALHLLCAALWLGALAPLRMLARAGDAARAGLAAERFGRVALKAVALLLLAGALLLWNLIGSAAAFWGSSYGRTLLVKLLLVAGLLSVAAINKLKLTPRLLKGEARAARQLDLSIGIEMLLGALILLATAALTTLSGPD